MNFSTLIAVIVCFSIYQIQAAEKCPGPTLGESQEDFKWKYDAAPIVAYGMVSDVTNNVAKLQIKCLLKGNVPLTELELPQLTEVTNTTDCHYLTAQKSYIVFLQTVKPASNDGKITYGLANMEEIEITATSVNAFISEECDDEDDENIDMTMFFYDQQRKCGTMETKCSPTNKAAILSLNLPPLTKTSTFLGGYRTVVPTPSGSSNDDGSNAGKSRTGTGDQQLRGAATLANICMPVIVAMASFALLFKA